MVRVTCSALGCNSSARTHDYKFHQFPHDAERRRIWLHACKRLDVIDKERNFFKNKYLCSKHFQKCMYTRKQNLKKSAVPTLYFSITHLKHDNSTQTVESMEYGPDFHQNANIKAETQNGGSMLYDLLKEKKRFTCTTQTEDIPYDIYNGNIKEETITDTKIEESELVEQDDEIKTENDDDDESDTKAFEDLDMKIDIVENPILPLVQIKDAEIMKGDKTLCPQAEKPLQEIDQSKTESVVKVGESCVTTNSINTNIMPIMQTKDESVQTERVIVLSQTSDTSCDASINPNDCKCKRNYGEMTREQFFRCCNRFLSSDFCVLVKAQMYLDGFKKQIETKKGGANSIDGAELETDKCECDLDEFFENQEVITPEVGVAITQMYLDGITKETKNNATTSSGKRSTRETKCAEGSAAKCRKVVTPNLIVPGQKIHVDDVTKQVLDDGASNNGSLAKNDQEMAVETGKEAAPKIVEACTGIADSVADKLLDM